MSGGGRPSTAVRDGRLAARVLCVVWRVRPSAPTKSPILPLLLFLTCTIAS